MVVRNKIQKIGKMLLHRLLQKARVGKSNWGNDSS